jgi:hypothetical protein
LQRESVKPLCRLVGLDLGLLVAGGLDWLNVLKEAIARLRIYIDKAERFNELNSAAQLKYCEKLPWLAQQRMQLEVMGTSNATGNKKMLRGEVVAVLSDNLSLHKSTFWLLFIKFHYELLICLDVLISGFRPTLIVHRCFAKTKMKSFLTRCR